MDQGFSIFLTFDSHSLPSLLYLIVSSSSTGQYLVPDFLFFCVLLLGHLLLGHLLLGLGVSFWVAAGQSLPHQQCCAADALEVPPPTPDSKEAAAPPGGQDREEPGGAATADSPLLERALTIRTIRRRCEEWYYPVGHPSLVMVPPPSAAVIRKIALGLNLPVPLTKAIASDERAPLGSPTAPSRGLLSDQAQGKSGETDIITSILKSVGQFRTDVKLRWSIGVLARLCGLPLGGVTAQGPSLLGVPLKKACEALPVEKLHEFWNLTKDPSTVTAATKAKAANAHEGVAQWQSAVAFSIADVTVSDLRRLVSRAIKYISSSLADDRFASTVATFGAWPALWGIAAFRSWEKETMLSILSSPKEQRLASIASLESILHLPPPPPQGLSGGESPTEEAEGEDMAALEGSAEAEGTATSRVSSRTSLLNCPPNMLPSLAELLVDRLEVVPPPELWFAEAEARKHTYLPAMIVTQALKALASVVLLVRKSPLLRRAVPLPPLIPLVVDALPPSLAGLLCAATTEALGEESRMAPGPFDEDRDKDGKPEPLYPQLALLEASFPWLESQVFPASARINLQGGVAAGAFDASAGSNKEPAAEETASAREAQGELPQRALSLVSELEKVIVTWRKSYANSAELQLHAVRALTIALEMGGSDASQKRLLKGAGVVHIIPLLAMLGASTLRRAALEALHLIDTRLLLSVAEVLASRPPVSPIQPVEAPASDHFPAAEEVGPSDSEGISAQGVLAACKEQVVRATQRRALLVANINSTRKSAASAPPLVPYLGARAMRSLVALGIYKELRTRADRAASFSAKGKEAGHSTKKEARLRREVCGDFYLLVHGTGPCALTFRGTFYFSLNQPPVSFVPSPP